MNIALEKEYIHSFIETADERILNIFKAIILSEKEKEEPEIEPILSDELIEVLNLCIDDVNNGDLMSSEEVGKKAREICMR